MPFFIITKLQISTRQFRYPPYLSLSATACDERLHWSRVLTGAHHSIAFTRGSNGDQVVPIGDWTSNNSVFPISRRSCDASPYTFSGDYRVISRLLSTFVFRLRVSC